MSEEVIVAEGLGKRYSLGSASPLMWFRKSSPRDELWAFRDVSFSIRRGEAVGIIGSNGAGKSTLLKVLSRVTAPTEGRARVRGRMGTILEVGTGFHPELTGRENIYLSGTILGMSKSEIDRRLDEIIEFAGVEKFVNTPVKRYSSGMYVRLAFAVAAHLEPDILIVDEVLAVGDVAFQKRCLAKMDSSIHQDGRTIIFVSHNMQAVRNLCNRAMLLKSGQLIADGPTAEVLRRYVSDQTSKVDVRDRALGNRLNRTRGYVRIADFSVLGSGASNRESFSFATGEELRLKISYDVIQPIESLAALVSISHAGTGAEITYLRPVIRSAPAEAGEGGEFTIVIPKLQLRPGEFSLMVGLGNQDFSLFEDIIDNNVSLPHLTVEAGEDDDWYSRLGVFSMEFEVSHSARSSRLTSEAS
jgi:lipopolysaccharide transport system ATP-binding protein